MTSEEALNRYTKCLASLTANNLGMLSDHVSTDVQFKDPFHSVNGLTKMEGVFRHLFEQVDNLEYKTFDPAMAQNGGFFRWHLRAKLSGKPWSVEGVTYVTFDANQKISQHIEYWDAASQLYERFPIIGSLLAFFRRRIAKT
jgi:hypothetical protein